jgi:hypothetical protein
LVGTGLIANLDDARLTQFDAGVLFDAMPACAFFPHRIDKGVVGLGWNLHPLARLDFL